MSASTGWFALRTYPSRSIDVNHGDSTDLNVVERQTIERAMREVKGNQPSGAARQLCFSCTLLYIRPRFHGSTDST
jgi:hypothetical protein